MIWPRKPSRKRAARTWRKSSPRRPKVESLEPRMMLSAGELGVLSIVDNTDIPDSAEVSNIAVTAVAQLEGSDVPTVESQDTAGPGNDATGPVASQAAAATDLLLHGAGSPQGLEDGGLSESMPDGLWHEQVFHDLSTNDQYGRWIAEVPAVESPEFEPLVETDSEQLNESENRIAYLTEQLRQSEKRVAGLQAAIGAANNRLDEIEGELQDISAQKERLLDAPEVATPSFHVKQTVGRRMLRVYYSDMPEGMSVELIKKKARRDIQPLCEGDGYVDLDVSRTPTLRNMFVGVVHTDSGERAGPPIRLRVRGAHIMSVRGFPQRQLRELAVAIEQARSEELNELTERTEVLTNERARLLACRQQDAAAITLEESCSSDLGEALRQARLENSALLLSEELRQSELRVASLRSAIDAANDRIAAIGDELQTLEAQEGQSPDPDAQVVTTSFRVEQISGQQMLRVTYAGMPEGISADFYKKTSRWQIAPLPPGSGFVDMPISYTSTLQSMYVALYSEAEDKWVSPAAMFNAQFGQIVNFTTKSNYEIPELAPAPEEDPEVDLQVDALVQERSGLIAERDGAILELADAETLITELEVSLRRIRAELSEKLGNAQSIFDQIHAWSAETPQQTSLEQRLQLHSQQYEELSALTRTLTAAIGDLQSTLQQDNVDPRFQLETQEAVVTLRAHASNWQQQNTALVAMLRESEGLAPLSNTDTLSFENPLEVVEGANPSLRIALENITGSVTVKSWQGARPSSNLEARTEASENGEGAQEYLTATCSVLSVDLHDADALVTTFDCIVQSSGNGSTITAGFFRGSTLIGQQQVTGEGAIAFEDGAGITGLVFIQSDTSAAISLSNVQVGADVEQFQADADALSSATNTWIAIHGAPRWASGEEYNYIEVGIHTGADYCRSLEKPVNGLPMIPSAMGSSAKYRRFTATGLNGSVQITGVYYINESGTYALPEEYYTQAGGSTVVVHTGSPEHLALLVRGRGNYLLNLKEGGSLKSLAPPQGVVIKPSILGFYDQHQGSGGFIDPVHEICQPSAPILSGAVRMVANIENVGRGSGNVTVRVYYGYTGSAADRLVQELTANFGPNEIKGLAVNLDNPSGGDGEYPTVTLAVTLPDGTEVMDYGSGGRYRSADRRVANGDGSYSYVSVPHTLEEKQRIVRIAYRDLTAAIERGDASRDYTGHAAASDAAVDAAIAALDQDQATVVEGDAVSELAGLVEELEAAETTLETQGFYLEKGASDEETVREASGDVQLIQTGPSFFSLSVGLVASAAIDVAELESLAMSVSIQDVLELAHALDTDQIDSLDPALRAFLSGLTAEQVAGVENVAEQYATRFEGQVKSAYSQYADVFTNACNADTQYETAIGDNDPDKYYVEIQSRTIGRGILSGSHTSIAVSCNGEVHSFGGRTPYFLLYFVLPDPLNVDIDNFAKDNTQEWSVRIEPPKGMTYRQWAEAVMGAGMNAAYNSGSLRYRLRGGDCGETTGNCHVATVTILKDAGGGVQMCLDPPGREPGLNRCQ